MDHRASDFRRAATQNIDPGRRSFSLVRIFLAIPQMRTMLLILRSFIRLKERRFFIPGHEQVFNRTKNAATEPHFDPKHE